MKALFAYFAAMAFFALSGAELTDGRKFTPGNLPEMLTAQLAVGKTLTFEIEENASTGYLWHGEVLSGKVELKLEHRHADAAPMVGVPGSVLVNITLRDRQPAKVRLFYSRSAVYNPDKTRAAGMGLVIINPADDAVVGDPHLIADQDELRWNDTVLSRASGYLVKVNCGHAVEFMLENAQSKWQVEAFDPAICRIDVMQKKRGFWPWRREFTSITVTGLGSGETSLVLAPGDRKFPRLNIRVVVAP